LNDQLRERVTTMIGQSETTVRLTGVLKASGIAAASWYRTPVAEDQRRRPGPAPKPIADEIVVAVVETATRCPWYGYKKIAIICRRNGHAVTDREAYKVMRDHGLLLKPVARPAELHQAAKLFELLPKKPNDLWQMDVTYIHIPGYGWHYAVTVIDYYSRYLLACHLTTSYCAAEVIHALKLARAEAERIHGPLSRQPFLVTDNGPSFLARRFGAYLKDRFSHVRIQYRTPTQLGLLERFHKTLKTEEVYWRLYDDPAHARVCLAEFRARYNEERPHWALVPEGGGDPGVPGEVYRGEYATEIPRWQTWAKGAQAKLEELLGEAA
jgi:transposase InsO family protein